jgi:hypothetical protein
MAKQILPEKPSGDEPVPRRPGKGQRKREGVLRTRRIKGKLVTKAKLMKARTSRANVRGGTRLGKARPETDQTGLVAGEEAPEGYVRFRMQVDDGRMSILGSHFVDSTSVTSPVLGGNFAYEVSDGEKRLHVGSLPDLGVTRSFANPSGPLELRRHHITPLSRYEFDVRVPVPALRRAEKHSDHALSRQGTRAEHGLGCRAAGYAVRARTGCRRACARNSYGYAATRNAAAIAAPSPHVGQIRALP